MNPLKNNYLLYQGRKFFSAININIHFIKKITNLMILCLHQYEPIECLGFAKVYVFFY